MSTRVLTCILPAALVSSQCGGRCLVDAFPDGGTRQCNLFVIWTLQSCSITSSVFYWLQTLDSKK